MYPETVEYEGIVYSVSVDYSASGDIQYWQLLDADGDIFYEMDWEGDFTADDVRASLKEEEERNPKSTELEEAEETGDGHTLVSEEASASEEEEKDEVDFSWFDFDYPHLAGYPSRFKAVVVRELEKGHYDSTAHEQIWVSELLEFFEDDPEGFFADYES